MYSKCVVLETVPTPLDAVGTGKESSFFSLYVQLYEVSSDGNRRCVCETDSK